MDEKENDLGADVRWAERMRKRVDVGDGWR